jgi:hypothetical protein
MNPKRINLAGYVLLMGLLASGGCSPATPTPSPTAPEEPVETAAPAALLPTPTPPPIPTAAPATEAATRLPPACEEADLVYHLPLHRMLLVNCFSQPSSANLPNAIWGWDGKAWEVVDDQGPEGRVVTGAAYDARRDVLVVYGGQPLTSTQCGRETWEWDRQAWVKKDTNSPAACDHFKMAYDSDRGEVILFGGQDEQQRPVAETWSYNGEAWQKVSEAGPESRAHFGFVYDRVHQQALIYGGYDGNVRDDFWSWRDGAWKQINFPGPGKRSHFGMVFDEERGVLVIFGGAKSSSTLSSLNAETWVLQGGAWSQVSNEGPSPRGSPAMAYDPERKRIVLYGGFTADQHELADTWEWDGRAWACLSNCP